MNSKTISQLLTMENNHNKESNEIIGNSERESNENTVQKYTELQDEDTNDLCKRAMSVSFCAVMIVRSCDTRHWALFDIARR